MLTKISSSNLFQTKLTILKQNGKNNNNHQTNKTNQSKQRNKTNKQVLKIGE